MVNTRLLKKAALISVAGVLSLGGASLLSKSKPAYDILSKLDDSHKYKNAKFPVDERVHDLLSRMTIEEKVAQMVGFYSKKAKWYDAKGVFQLKLAKEDLKTGMGHIYGLFENRTAKESAIMANAIQKYAMENTRLGIPIFFSDDMLNAHRAKDATAFPIELALASTWDRELVAEVYKTISLEGKVRGGHVALGPCVDVCREPRWGGVGNTFGEDPFLVTQMGLAAVKEIQGPGPQLRMAAVVSHFGVGANAEGGYNGGPSDVSDRTFREIFLPPFRQIIKDGKVSGIMIAPNEYQGVPMHANKVLVTDILRKELNYDGMVVSEREGIINLFAQHNLVNDDYAAAKIAFQTGIDVELPEDITYHYLVKMVKQKEISESVINKAVGRVLKLKFLMGLFENPYVDATNAEQTVGCQNHRYTALKAAQMSMILLRNEKNTLPLVKRTLKSIAVIGPNANKAILGANTEKPLNQVTVLQGIKDKVLKETQVLYAEGCKITKDGQGWKSDSAKMIGYDDSNKKLIEEAVQAAKQAEVVLLVLGSNDQVNRITTDAKHLGDRADMDLPGAQNELVKAVLATGKPVIVYLMNSSPLTLNYIHNKVPAIIEGWFAGQETGTALADILFGDINPGGKLPITIPRNSGQLPAYYNYKKTSRLGYAFEDNTPLYPFGFGLSYTQFEYEAPVLAKAKIKADGKVTVSIKVTNIGKVKGDEVVQLYLRDEISSVTRPVKELRGFKRVTLLPQESKTVDFDLDVADFQFLDLNMAYTVEKGKFTIFGGGNSAELKSAQLEIE